jgi:hypothetical protein
MLGHFLDLPYQQSGVVRVFISSTFGDTVEERNRLMRKTFPALRAYCQEVGLELEIADMRWGVRDEAISGHLTSAICLQEIRNCQSVSPGLNFLVK